MTQPEKHTRAGLGVPEEVKFRLSGKISSWEGFSSPGTAGGLPFLQGFHSSVHVGFGNVVSGGFGSAGDGWIPWSERAFPKDSMILTMKTSLKSRQNNPTQL